MIFKKQDTVPEANFDAVKPGHVFLWNNGTFLKASSIVDGEKRYFAVNLHTGESAEIPSDVKVTRVHTELLVSVEA